MRAQWRSVLLFSGLAALKWAVLKRKVNFVSILSSVRSIFVPINRAGYPFIAAFAVTGLVFGAIWPISLAVTVPLTVWCVYFFRDPPRVTVETAGIVVSPADGRIVAASVCPVPAELADLGQQTAIKVSIFMSVFDCHVNRAPISGTVTKQVYCPGVFVNAELDKASANNERNALILDTQYGLVGVVQVAGLIARRIVSWVKEGDELTIGKRFGLIRFGSKLDVYLPLSAAVRVSVGQRAVAGETVLADIGGDAATWDQFSRS